MKFLLRIILSVALSAFALFVAAKYVPDIEISSPTAAITAVALLFVARFTLKPILSIISLPVTLITLGLFSFVINGVILLVVAKIVEGFSINSLFAAIVGAIVISVIKTLGGKLIEVVL